MKLLLFLLPCCTSIEKLIDILFKIFPLVLDVLLGLPPGREGGDHHVGNGNPKLRLKLFVADHPTGLGFVNVIENRVEALEFLLQHRLVHLPDPKIVSLSTRSQEGYSLLGIPSPSMLQEHLIQRFFVAAGVFYGGDGGVHAGEKIPQGLVDVEELVELVGGAFGDGDGVGEVEELDDGEAAEVADDALGHGRVVAEDGGGEFTFRGEKLGSAVLECS
nr:hypothetical protein Iba_chr01cCG1100 [Ipomoea batatas]